MLRQNSEKMVNYAIRSEGVVEHSAFVQKELLYIHELQNLLRQLDGMTELMSLDSYSLRKCIEKFDVVEESIRHRLQILADLPYKVNELSTQIDEIIADMRINNEEYE